MRPAAVPPPRTRTELAALVVAAWLALVSVPLALGGIGLSWDALNHQVYLGWVADAPRFDRDYLAASYQAYQFPYLYWPLYKLVQHGLPGQWAGVILASLNVLVVPPLWMIARAAVPDRDWYGVAMRWLAVALAFLSAVVLTHLDSTSNDLLAAIPLVWAVALALQPAAEDAHGRRAPSRLVLLSGLAAGISVAFKLSNGPLAVVLPLLWALRRTGLRARLLDVAGGSLATLVGFGVCYGYWGWQLWSHFGNPVYPFHGGVVDLLRAALGLQR